MQKETKIIEYIIGYKSKYIKLQYRNSKTNRLCTVNIIFDNYSKAYSIIKYHINDVKAKIINGEPVFSSIQNKRRYNDPIMERKDWEKLDKVPNGTIIYTKTTSTSGIKVIKNSKDDNEYIIKKLCTNCCKWKEIKGTRSRIIEIAKNILFGEHSFCSRKCSNDYKWFKDQIYVIPCKGENDAFALESEIQHIYNLFD